MFKNYIKLAFKVMRRRKFFSFISMFGISLTLMILIIVVAFLQNELGANGPMKNQDELVFLNYIKRLRIEQDTIMEIDSSILDGRLAYDTTYNYADKTTSTSTGPFGMKVYNDYLNKMVEPKLVTLYAHGGGYDLFRDENKIQMKANHVDPNYWEIFDFDFTEGSRLKSSSIEKGLQEVVISDIAAERYFGRKKNLVGETMELGRREYQVVGVVEAVTNSKEYISADLYLPIGTMPDQIKSSRENYGPFNAIFMASSSGRKEAIIEELAEKAKIVDMSSEVNLNTVQFEGKTFMEQYSQEMLSLHGDEQKNSVTKFILVITLILMLFVLLPTLNLVNLNVTRILDRSSEIGVRKAFGANRGNLLNQFVFENIIITFIGGAIGLLLAIAALKVINKSNVLGDVQLEFNLPVFLLSFIVCLVFGIISGLLPALRMSKLSVVNALKSNPS